MIMSGGISEEVVKKPFTFGIPHNWVVHSALQFNADESPVHYADAMKRTLVTASEKSAKQIRAHGGAHRRMVTGTPLTNRIGEALLFQFIFRGKTSQCLPKLPTSTKPLFPLGGFSPPHFKKVA